jgi:CRISPR-associated protein Csd1
MIDEVIASFTPDDFIRDKRLSGEFLLGYHSQRDALRSKRMPRMPSNKSLAEAAGRNP